MEKEFICLYCGKEFSRKTDLSRHENHSCKQNKNAIPITKRKIACRYCGKEIDVSNIHKHEVACSNPNSKLNKKKSNVASAVDYNADLTCRYCGRQFKDARNLVIHEKYICELNQNITDEQRLLRKKLYAERYLKMSAESKKAMNWSKGLTAETSLSIANRKNPEYAELNEEDNIYFEHNQFEKDKWFKYIDSVTIDVPNYKCINAFVEGYKIVATKDHSTLLEHRFVASWYVSNINSLTIVHHIDKNKWNNDIHNLMVFCDKASHNRYHRSKNAYLTYDENTHMFTCELK